jgi:sugar O-acyltransferase (sialic acid O-acetyltransferase NeuD family)
MDKLIIFGTGDIARLAHFYFNSDSPYEVVAFTVDHQYKRGDQFLGLPLISFEEISTRYPHDSYSLFIAISYANLNRLRAEKYKRSKQLGYKMASYISSKCTFLTNRPIGDNCFILEDNTIQPFVSIGNNTTIWSGNHVGHDATIGDHCFISSHVVISGRVNIRPYCFIGVNATIRNGITIANDSLIGAGAVIMADTAQGAVYVPSKTKKLDYTSNQIEI